MANEPIHDVIERWHQHMRGQLSGGLDELLHDDVVFTASALLRNSCVLVPKTLAYAAFLNADSQNQGVRHITLWWRRSSCRAAGAPAS